MSFNQVVNWLAPYQLPAAPDPPGDYGPAKFDADGRLEYKSATLLFKGSTVANGRKYYHCAECTRICRKHAHIPEARLRTRSITVVDGRIVGRDPDLAGSNCGHLCQKPHLVAMIQANVERKNQGLSGIADEVPLATAGDPQLQKDVDEDGGIIFGEEVPGEPPQNREQTKSSKTQIDTNDGSSAGHASTSRRRGEPQADAPPRKRAKNNRDPSKVPSASAEADDVNVAGGVGNAPPVAVTPADALLGDPSRGFKPVFGKAVPAGPTSVKFEGVFGTYTFELAKEGSRVVGGVRVPVKAYRCVECFKIMERAGRRQDVPFVIVANGSFVEHNPEIPMGNEHFCWPGNH